MEILPCENCKTTCTGCKDCIDWVIWFRNSWANAKKLISKCEWINRDFEIQVVKPYEV